QSYIRELQGHPKQRERLVSLVRNRHLLKRRFGKVHMAAGVPLVLSDLVPRDGTAVEQKDVIGSAIMDRIRKTMPVTACSLLAAVTIGLPPHQSFSENAVIDDAIDLVLAIRDCHPESRLADDVRSGPGERSRWLAAIERMVEYENFIPVPSGGLQVNPNRRYQVDYLRNSIMGLLLGPALVAWERLHGSRVQIAIDDVAGIVCTDWHPIPLDRIRNEIVMCREKSAEWPTSRMERLARTVAPMVAVCDAILEGLNQRKTPVDGIISSDWASLFRDVVGHTLPGYPEMQTAVLQTALYKGFKRSCPIHANPQADHRHHEPGIPGSSETE
ncbi:hypothetical protein JXA80_09905, partial [bacterium]|nr:hypothetical protein [candidate division CSSED10-310 bacterium]